MLFLYLLIALTAVAAAIFATPLRRKVWTALALTAAGALWCSARAVGVLAGADSGPCGRSPARFSAATPARWTGFRRCSS